MKKRERSTSEYRSAQGSQTQQHALYCSSRMSRIVNKSDPDDVERHKM